jgi:hypothetical protein
MDARFAPMSEKNSFAWAYSAVSVDFRKADGDDGPLRVNSRLCQGNRRSSAMSGHPVWGPKFRKEDFRLLIGSCETVPTESGCQKAQR